MCVLQWVSLSVAWETLSIFVCVYFLSNAKAEELRTWYYLFACDILRSGFIFVKNGLGRVVLLCRARTPNRRANILDFFFFWMNMSVFGPIFPKWPDPKRFLQWQIFTIENSRIIALNFGRQAGKIRPEDDNSI